MRKILLLILLTGFISEKLLAQCTPVITGNPGATSDYINNFTFGAISNLNSGDNAADYALYPQTGNYTQSLSYPFTIQTGSPTWGQGLGMWIDFNGNNSFLDLGEFVWSSPTAANTSANILSGNITIPVAAVPGVRRMRIACKFNNLVVAADECGFNGFGEYEDYNITIVANVACSGTPVGGTASVAPVNPCPGIPVTLNLAGQTLAGGLAYQWVVSPTGLPGSFTTLPGATTIPYTYIPAAGSTNYYRCIVTCTNPGGGFDTSIVSSSCTVQPWSPTNNCWCVPTYASGGASDNVAIVSFGAMTNNTVAAANPAPFWVDYTPQQVANAIPTPIIYIGLASNLTVTHGA
ncbi:MAG: hypothetical protein IT257_10975, partial [Chitinophagaceae bacterium]|nr:hypothetical protein [Chitinophagaceae bacterium]